LATSNTIISNLWLKVKTISLSKSSKIR
jgi:hypothetical protein